MAGYPFCPSLFLDLVLFFSNRQSVSPLFGLIEIIEQPVDKGPPGLILYGVDKVLKEITVMNALVSPDAFLGIQ